jgi:surface protein
VSAFNQDIGRWNEYLGRRQRMFAGASAFDQDIGHWNTANVQNTWGVLMNTKSKSNQNNIGAWDTSKLRVGSPLTCSTTPARSIRTDISRRNTTIFTDMT